MLGNNWKILLRHIQRQGLHTVLSIGGLSIGLVCFLLIALYIRSEISFDKQFKESSSIYRITMSSQVGGNTNYTPTTYAAFAGEINASFGEVSQVTRVYNYKYSRMVPTFRHGDNTFYEDQVIFADSTFFTVFDFAFLQGNPLAALRHPTAVVITESVARKYFGEQPALGKTMLFNNETTLEVTGVIQDPPPTTHLQFQFVLPLTAIGYSGTFRSAKVLDSWNVDWFWVYLVIPDHTAVPQVEKRINELATARIPETQKEFNIRFYLQALTDVHLYSDFDYNTDLTPNGDIQNLFIFASAAVLVLLISAINFINITLAGAMRRYKEIGISKALGAMTSTIRIQFLAESAALCLVALAGAFLVLPVLIPVFNQLLGVNLTFFEWSDRWIILGMLLFTGLLGIAAGWYPAIVVSSLQPQRVLKGVWNAARGGASFRKLLVGIQVTISMFLIIGTLVIYDQLQYLQNKSLGYDRDQLVMLTIRGTKLTKQFYSFKNRLLNESSIVGVSSVSEPIGREVQFMQFAVEGQDQEQYIKILNVTSDFVKTMGLEMADGRDFSRDVASDSTSGFLINEAAARAFGWKEPVGKAIDHAFREVKQGRVIGVLKDFNFEPLHKQVDPLVVWFGSPNWYAAVRVEKGRAAEALAVIEREWKRVEPDKPLAFQFLDQSINRVYEQEQRLRVVFSAFSLLSIVAAVLGLYGLIAFIMKNRLGEIAIRKVMGASVNNILLLVGKEYAVLVFIAFVAAAPITYLTINLWLQRFAFHVEWTLAYFVAGLLVSSFTVLTTVSLKALGAARANPVDVLRSE